MRIKKVRFKNLNSLYGEWEIDLSDNEYLNDGIFAITGPTGSGKSTILDAICLALYGQTPRLNKITNSNNDLMSRKCGECFSEVIFEIQNKEYRCFWYQHRSRKQGSGELQNARHELTDHQSNQILHTGLSVVPGAIKEITSLGFEDFTRSMLLAQGSFSAFLQAAPGERSPILEQITGTEIYSTLSKIVYTRYSDEKDKMNELQTKMSGIHLLSTEELTDYQNQLDTLSEKEIKEQTKEEQIIQAQNWLINIEKLKKETEVIIAKELEAEKKKNDFTGFQLKLDKAKKALEFSGLFNSLLSLRSELKNIDNNLHENLKNLAIKTSNLQLEESKLKEQADTLKSFSEDFENLKPLLTSVRALDIKINEKNNTSKPLHQRLDNINAEINATQNQYDKINKLHEMNTKDLNLALNYLKINEIDHSLSTDMESINLLTSDLKKIIKERQIKAESLKSLNLNLDSLRNNMINQEKDLHKNQDSLDQFKNIIITKTEEIYDLLKNKTVSDLFRDLSTWKEKKAMYEKVYSLYSDQIKLIDKDKMLHDQILALDNEIDILKVIIDEKERNIAEMESEIKINESAYLLLIQIQNYDQARQQLKDGEPCPLCGSPDHPFALGNIPVINESKKLLNKKKNECEKLKDQLNKQIVKLKSSENDKTKMIKELSLISQEIMKNKKDLDQLNKDPDQKLSIENYSEILNSLIMQSNHTISIIETTINQAEKLIHSKEKQEKLYQNLKIIVDQTKESLIKTENQINLSTQQISQTKQLEQDLIEKEQNLLFEIQTRFKKYIQKEIKPENIDSFYKILIKRLTIWNDNIASREKKDKEIRILETQMTQLKEKIETNKQFFSSSKEEYSLLMNDLETLFAERHSIFQKKNPDEEEKRYIDILNNKKIELEMTEKTFSQLKIQTANLQTLIEEGKAQINKRSEDLKNYENQFLLKIIESGFPDEKSYQESCLNEEERNNLEFQAKEITDQINSIKVLKDNNKQNIIIEESRILTESNSDELNKEADTIKETLKDIRVIIGGIKEKMSNNQKLIAEQKENIEAINKQNIEYQRWAVLNKLIGSGNGTKFRNFAQGLTFDYLINYANEHLAKMNDRYLLIRDNLQSLDLSIQDLYQAGEIRSTKNLSGGESFIVSLSLALGLSQMVSNKIRIDSLFLDEGFGTLDEEALDTALNALSGLRHDNKLVGIISHVLNIRERILTQIQVSPIKSGRSALLGPGCRRLD